MKTTNLVIGLIEVVGGVCGLFALMCIATFGLPVAVLIAVGGAVNMVVGINNVMDSLFGNDGLICEAFGRVEEDDAV